MARSSNDVHTHSAPSGLGFQSGSEIRRIVTGHGSNGLSKVMIDGLATNSRTREGRKSTLIWCTDGMPSDISVGENFDDMGSRRLGTPPPPNGTRFTINEIPPGSKPVMHRTETLDYAIVLSGEIDMTLDDLSTTHLKAGDVVVQRGTNHSWANNGREMARVAFVLIDAKPLGVGQPVTHGQAVGES